MTITNNTQHASIYYSTSQKGGVDCGNLKPGDDVVLYSYDNKPDVKITLTISKTGDETVIDRGPGSLTRVIRRALRRTIDASVRRPRSS
jgi:hypothetical protein